MGLDTDCSLRLSSHSVSSPSRSSPVMCWLVFCLFNSAEHWTTSLQDRSADHYFTFFSSGRHGVTSKDYAVKPCMNINLIKTHRVSLAQFHMVISWSPILPWHHQWESRSSLFSARRVHIIWQVKWLNEDVIKTDTSSWHTMWDLSLVCVNVCKQQYGRGHADQWRSM